MCEQLSHAVLFCLQVAKGAAAKAASDSSESSSESSSEDSSEDDSSEPTPTPPVKKVRVMQEICSRGRCENEGSKLGGGGRSSLPSP